MSPCHEAKILFSLGDGVSIGCCGTCHSNVVRVNPGTGVQEWLDGNSPWTKRSLRPVERAVLPG